MSRARRSRWRYVPVRRNRTSGTVEALKRTLLDAKSIVYADPSKGGASGVYFAHVLDRLGIADQLKSKTILVPGPQAAEVVAKGEAEIGVAQSSEIVPVAGAEVLGPLPGERTSTRPMAGMLGTALSVAAKMTIADPGTPCAPFEVTSDTPRIKSRSPSERGVFVACAMNTVASVR